MANSSVDINAGRSKGERHALDCGAADGDVPGSGQFVEDDVGEDRIGD
jgi:hypothetical protein